MTVLLGNLVLSVPITQTVFILYFCKFVGVPFGG